MVSVCVYLLLISFKMALSEIAVEIECLINRFKRMKKNKFILLVITMFATILTFGQEKTIHITLSNSIKTYKIDKDFNLLKLRGNKYMNISNDALIVVNDSIYTDNQVKHLNINSIKKINIIKNQNPNGVLVCDGSEKNSVIIVTLEESEVKP